MLLARASTITRHTYYDNTLFPQISELQFPNQQPSADHSLIRLLPSTLVVPVEIDRGSQILESLGLQMGAVIHSGWPPAVSKQPRDLLDNKQQTHTCNNHVFFWATSNQHAQWLPKSIITTCPSGQQATDTHVSHSRVLLGNKQPPRTVITYDYHNHVSFWAISNRHTRVTVTYSSGQQATIMHSDYIWVSQPRVLLDKQETTRVTVTCSSGQQTPSIQSNYPQRHKYMSWTITWQKCDWKFRVTNMCPLWTTKNRHTCIIVRSVSTKCPHNTCRNEVVFSLSETALSLNQIFER
jgi:hypothetical protein